MKKMAKHAIIILFILALTFVTLWLRLPDSRDCRQVERTVRDETTALRAHIDGHFKRLDGRLDRLESKLDRLIEKATPKLPDGMRFAE